MQPHIDEMLTNGSNLPPLLAEWVSRKAAALKEHHARIREQAKAI
jgi:hypothetical protein